ALHQFKANLDGVMFIEGGNKLLVHHDKRLLWDTKTGKELGEYAPKMEIEHDPINDELAIVIDSQRERLFVGIGHTALITSIVISPNERFLLSGSNDGTVRLWALPKR